jgi:hypothetical protein
VSYATQLLRSLEIAPARGIDDVAEHPALTWARSGSMALTGFADAEPLMCPLPIATCADGALSALASLAPEGAFADLRGSSLLAERAAIAALSRNGPVSPGGGTWLLDTPDGAIGVSLTREDDWTLVPAWLEIDAEPSWDVVRRAVACRSLHHLVERGRLVGLAVAPSVPPPSRSVRWFVSDALGAGYNPQFHGQRARDKPLVVDLSSLWAGPLCTSLLQRCGADVIKIESVKRPDGARRGPAAFFDLMNAGKRCIALDFADAEHIAMLRTLIARADIVVEASRPRALQQLGIDARALLAENPCLTWISITGYGRGDPQGGWIAYGDDAGVAAGLSYLMQQAHGLRVICGDAIADPLTGMHAALAAWVIHRQGGGRLVSLALVDVVRHCVQFDLPASGDELRARLSDWMAVLGNEKAASPRARAAPGKARALGQDNDAVLAEVA